MPHLARDVDNGRTWGRLKGRPAVEALERFLHAVTGTSRDRDRLLDRLRRRYPEGPFNWDLVPSLSEAKQLRGVLAMLRTPDAGSIDTAQLCAALNLLLASPRTPLPFVAVRNGHPCSWFVPLTGQPDRWSATLHPVTGHRQFRRLGRLLDAIHRAPRIARLLLRAEGRWMAQGTPDPRRESLHALTALLLPRRLHAAAAAAIREEVAGPGPALGIVSEGQRAFDAGFDWLRRVGHGLPPRRHPHLALAPVGPSGVNDLRPLARRGYRVLRDRSGGLALTDKEWRVLMSHMLPSGVEPPPVAWRGGVDSASWFCGVAANRRVSVLAVSEYDTSALRLPRSRLRRAALDLVQVSTLRSNLPPAQGDELLIRSARHLAHLLLNQERY